MSIQVSECYIYPLKSAQGTCVDSLELTPKGPRHDRLWMLVKDTPEEKGKFISQRDKGYEKLSLISTVIVNEDQTHFTLPNKDTLSISKSDLTKYNGSVTVWGDTCQALDAGDKAADLFSDHFGQPCRLVKMADNFVRPTSPNYSQPDDQVSFADGFPLLVTNHASLEALKEHMAEDNDVNMQRFRPNIVLEKASAFEEDVIHKVRIGSAILEFVKPCTRCKITTIDQQTGLSLSNEPLKTLTKTRRGKGNGLQGVFFGQNAIARKLGRINIGDRVEILAKRDLHPALQNALLRPQIL